ncbi:hypothetical protein SEA_EWALD_8 [Gordonia phage Ewald]|nr:hypothetical protein SEA_EWALD_8 [Gordonia phage Ewald]
MSEQMAREARITSLYDAALAAVSLPDADVWPGVMLPADPDEALFVLVSMIAETGQRIPADVADRIVDELPELADSVNAARGVHRRHAS